MAILRILTDVAWPRASIDRLFCARGHEVVARLFLGSRRFFVLTLSSGG